MPNKKRDIVLQKQPTELPEMLNFGGYTELKTKIGMQPFITITNGRQKRLLNFNLIKLNGGLRMAIEMQLFCRFYIENGEQNLLCRFHCTI